MVDFKKLVPDLQHKAGKCNIPYDKYASISGIRICCNTQKENVVNIYWRIDEVENNKIITFLNGVTGYEAYRIKDLVCNGFLEKEKETITICVGTNNKWDTLKVNGNAFRKIVKEALEVFI